MLYQHIIDGVKVYVLKTHQKKDTLETVVFISH